MRGIIYVLLLGLASVGGCSEALDPAPDAPLTGGSQDPPPQWLIPEHRVFDGGPGKDGIPSIDQPVFVSVEEAGAWLQAQDLVTGLRIGEEVRAYPHAILDWHEIVNDSVGGEAVAIAYCPLTGTSTCWSRHLRLGFTTFGVSGLLFNTNLIPYDRETDSHWSQLLNKAVEGPEQGQQADLYPLVETTWETWKMIFPDSKVLSRQTGFDRPYGEYPYGDYKTAQTRLFFPVVPVDQRIPLKERVLGIQIDEKARVYRLGAFGDSISVFHDRFQDKRLVVAGSRAQNWGVAYGRQLPDGTLLDFFPSSQGFPAIMEDGEGNTWDIFGSALAGPRKGQNLPFYPALMGYWLSFSSFFPRPEIIQ